jgi:glycosyltransferase involved in cell wall biosynthesis
LDRAGFALFFHESIEMFKILYITNGIVGAGGLERVLSIKASYLADKMDYEVHVLTLNQNDAPQFYKFSSKIVLHDIKAGGNPVRYFLQYFNGINKIVKTVKPDVIAVCDDGLKGFFLPLLLSKPCPMIYERHASVQLNYGAKASIIKKLKNMLLHSVMIYRGSFFDAFVLLTNGNKKEWPLSNLKVIPNPLSFYPDIHSSVSSIVMAVGSHSYNKGYDLLLSVWQIVIRKHPSMQLYIYGKIDEEQTYLKMAVELGINKSVHFFDPVPNIHEKYQEASIIVLPSRSEGFSMVLIEAMACGVPCVSFDCPCGPADIIQDGIDGFLVTNGDIDAFANKIITLIDDENLRQRMGSNARENVKRYLPDEIMPQWDTLFRSIVQ